MSSLFNILEKERNTRNYKYTDEVVFFNKFKGMLKINPYFAKYLDCENDFDIIKANIIIKAIINKEELDKIINDTYLKYDQSSIDEIKELIKEQVSDLPYIDYDNFKVYIPFFNKATNIVYSVENEKMKEYPYIELTKKYEPFLVEAFETYTIDVFNSLFTQLVKVDESKTTMAFYHYDFNAIFIINRQGTLDNIIYLFDKYLINPHKYNIIERIKPLIRAYYNNDLGEFVNLLYKNGFVSYYVFRKICKVKKI